MLDTLQPNNSEAIKLIPLTSTEFNAWLVTQSASRKNWLKSNQFEAKPKQMVYIPSSNGEMESVVFGIEGSDDFWAFGSLPKLLPDGVYQIFDEQGLLSYDALWRAHLAWGLGAYRFATYKKFTKPLACLAINAQFDLADLHLWLESFYNVRDLINTPCEDLAPLDLAGHAKALAKRYKAKCDVIEGEKLKKHGLNAIYAVGKGSPRPPCLVDLNWGDKNAPKVTIVGKGICFDTGGLDIKSAAGMIMMKKDMGGAAFCLGLAQMIMAKQLPIRLRVLLACAENAVGGNSYRPSDVIRMHNGLTVEVGNTDAEGRLVLADALSYASDDKPDLLMDFATLTGAARIALGPDLPVLMSNQSDIAHKLLSSGECQQDPLWQLPLHQRYNKWLSSNIADLNNVTTNRFAGAIVAGLFLEHFVGENIPWVHVDTFGYNSENLPGRPKGGEALALRAVFHYLVDTFA